ncbi:MAG: isopentenyl phosphate kinase [Anaerolineae bacterium]|jgi:isopentenyl phosphate kinase
MAGGELVFVKLGGSVITDKTRPQAARPDVIRRLAGEIAAARAARPDRASRLVLGHGSGSFGHVLARRYGTRHGVEGAEAWHGFARVAAVAARLNRLVTAQLLEAGLPAWSLQPSASARCRQGQLLSLEIAPLEKALVQGLIPLVYGDVALDEAWGGTIVSTEQIFAYLARRLGPARLVMVGVVDGVFEGDPLRDPSARPVPRITPANWPAIRTLLGGSHATDVTGGMAAKVQILVDLVSEMPGSSAHLLSGERPGALAAALSGEQPGAGGGTLILWS